LTTPFRLLAATATCAAAGGIAVGLAVARVAYPALELVFSGGMTVIGQPIAYPDGAPDVTAAIVAMQPGQTTGPHRHDAPLFAYMLEGELTVDYGADGTRTYHAGDGFLEAFRTVHDGTNTGDGVARVLAVFIGADGVANTVTGAD